MLTPDPAARGLFDAVAAMARRASKDELKQLVEAGLRSKPPGYDKNVAGMAQRMRGDQVAIVKRALEDRYPNAGKMPVNPVNWLSTFARSSCGVYDTPADRYLEEDGVALADEHPRAKAFNRALDDIGINKLMPELERRANAGCKAAVVEIVWSKVSDDDEGRPVATMYWPSDVIVLCHPSAPANPRAALVVALRQTSTSTTALEERWAIYSRSYVEHPNGRVKQFGDWHYAVACTDASGSLPQPIPNKRLPVVFVRTEQPDGGFWPVPEADVLAQVDELNISRSNEQHTVDMQGHGQGVYSGAEQEAADLVLGADRLLAIGPGESMTTLDFNPHLEEMRGSREGNLREVAISRGDNPDSVAMTPTVAISGVSRAIANLAHDKRIGEQRPGFHAFEVEEFLPVLLETLDLYAPPSYAPTFGDAVKPRVVLGKPPDYEEIDTKARRLKEDRDDGIISPARYAVGVGHYDDVRAAVAAGLSNDLKVAPKPTPFGTPGVPDGPRSARPAAGGVDAVAGEGDIDAVE